MMATSERRVAVVCINTHDVLDWFTFVVNGWPERLDLPHFDGIPADVSVKAVRENFYTRQFEFLVSHPSFDEVPEGVPPPVLPGMTQRMRTCLGLRGGDDIVIDKPLEVAAWPS